MHTLLKIFLNRHDIHVIQLLFLQKACLSFQWDVNPAQGASTPLLCACTEKMVRSLQGSVIFPVLTTYTMQTTGNAWTKCSDLTPASLHHLLGMLSATKDPEEALISLFSRCFRGDFFALLKQNDSTTCARASDINEHSNSEGSGCLHLLRSRLTTVNSMDTILGMEAAQWFLLMAPSSSAGIFLALLFLYFNLFSCWPGQGLATQMAWELPWWQPTERWLCQGFCSGKDPEEHIPTSGCHGLGRECSKQCR